MNSVVMSIRGLPSSELWVPILLVVPISSSQNQMVLGGSSGSSDFKIVGFDWSYQSQIQKWYFVICTESSGCTEIYEGLLYTSGIHLGLS